MLSRWLIKIIIFSLFALLLLVPVFGNEISPERKLDEAISEVHGIMSNRALDNGTKERRIKLVASRLLEKQLIARYEKGINKLDERIAIKVVSGSSRLGCICFYREIRIWESQNTARLYRMIFRFRFNNGNWLVYEIN